MDSGTVKDGACVIAESLKQQGVAYMFGVVGIPIIEVAIAAQNAGVKYIGMRNEQAASYAASAIGYLTKRPAACLVVPGPGLIHALAGISNASVNCWPLVVIAGSVDQDQVGRGAFQEWPQLQACQQCCKYSVRVDTLASIPFHVEKAVRMSIYGRPGPCYIEIPGDFVNGDVAVTELWSAQRCPDPPLSLADPTEVSRAVTTLCAAQRPLIVIGKGAAYARAEREVRLLVTTHSLPFLPTPMGKGVVPDDHPLCVSAARSKALKEADVVVLLGARLNWILHFGLAPRFHPQVKIVQVDISPEEMNNNVPAHVMLCGDVKAVVHELNAKLSAGSHFICDPHGPWWSGLRDKMAANAYANTKLAADKRIPMTFYSAYKQITKFLPRNSMIINEGSSTMDIGRTMLMTHLPRHRLDAGTFGTMGIGCGFAIAAALVQAELKGKGEAPSPVFCIQGDSAFGFSGMELETAARYQLPIIFLVMNNNGIYRGVDGNTWNELVSDPKTLPFRIPPTCFLPGVCYDQVARGLGGGGSSVSTPDELKSVLATVLSQKDRRLPYLINIEIDPSSSRRAQEFPWLTRSKL